MKASVILLVSLFEAFSAIQVSAQVAAPAPYLASGQWAKFSVEKNGVYKIDAGALRKAGFNPNAIDPQKISLFAYPTGMLPQANGAPRATGLQEVAIVVQGETDGVFNSDDVILFYGQGPDKLEYNPRRNIFSYENNLYSDKNFYFLTVGSNPGKRIQSAQVVNGTPVVTEVLDYAYYETDSYNSERSGREWFGESFSSSLTLTIRFDVPGIVPDSEIKMVSSVMAQSYQEAGFKAYWNNRVILDRKMQTIPETQYGVKGRIGQDTLTFTATSVEAVATANQDIKYEYLKAANYSQGYLNYLLFQVKRKASWYGNPTSFTLPPSANEFVTIELASAPTGLSVWDVTDPFNSEAKSFFSAGSTARISTGNLSVKNFIAFTQSNLPVPLFEEVVAPQNICAYSTPELIIIAHPDFLSEANRLANHRTEVNNLDVLVVTPQQIYNDFSGGRQDVSALRNYVKMMYDKQPGRLKNLLLFGRGSYDYKKRVFNNSNLVPTYESRNSLSPLETYSSDDYFGFLEDSEGEWNESPAKNHTLDIGVGRLPVRTALEAKEIVDKLIAYDTDPDRYAGWRQAMLFVADDGDFNIHQSQADQLAESIEQYGGFTTDKIYLDAFEQTKITGGQRSPKAAEALNLKINKGFSIVNFTGHGSEQLWMQEQILDMNTPAQLTNNPRLPLFVTATCEFGRHDDPLMISTAELLLLKKKGGAIGLVTTTRPVNSGTNFSLNKAFYEAFFNSTTPNKDLGSIFRETKNKSQSGVGNRNFSLLADPSLRFGPPQEKIAVRSITTENGNDTLQAFAKAILEGEIQHNGTVSSDFNGTVEVTLFDKRTLTQTKGDENPPFNYYVWNHALFRGKATVAQGEFLMELRLPVGIKEEIGAGKLVMYAFSNDKKREAQGTTQFKIGGSDVNPPADSDGPLIELYMGDTSFEEGGFTNSDTRLVGKLFDENGINISGYGNANLVGVLDDQKTFFVNDYFVADLDDYTRGSFTYPLSGLSPGRHTIRFTAFDNLNNQEEATIHFEVGEAGQLFIDEVINYPNPFSEKTTIQFTHSRSGDDLQAQVVIYDMLGQLADSREFTIPASTYKVNLFDWGGFSNSGVKMNSGIYIMRLSVRSLSDGAKKESFAKIILVN